MYRILICALLCCFSVLSHGQTVINEQDGPLTTSEHALLDSLDRHGIPTPDSIVVLADTVGTHGYVDHIGAPRTVHLTTTRMEHPDADTLEGFPYLFGVETTTYSETPAQVHILAHEIAHLLSTHLDAEMGRPALGIHLGTSEIQAEILGLVFMNLAFGMTADQLGFPTTVEYPFIQNKSVKTLQRQYCYITKKTWSVDALDCNYGL